MSLRLCGVLFLALTLAGHSPTAPRSASSSTLSCTPLGAPGSGMDQQSSFPTCYLPSQVQVAEHAFGLPALRPWAAIRRIAGNQVHPFQETVYPKWQITYVETAQPIVLDFCVKGPVPYLEVVENAARTPNLAHYPLTSVVWEYSTSPKDQGACPTLTTASFGLAHPHLQIFIRSNLPELQVKQIVGRLRGA